MSPPLPIYPDAVLSGPVASELLQPVARWYAQIAQDIRGIEHGQLAECDELCRFVHSARSPPMPDGFGVLILEGSEHTPHDNATRY
jgi:hypothetical protein